MTFLWTAESIATATGGRWLVQPALDWSPNRISYDVSGNMAGHFCVLTDPGTWGAARVDASPHVPRMIAQGAAGIMLQSSHLTELSTAGSVIPQGFPALLVENTYTALRAMAVAARARFGGTVFAITGTVGKTTTREMIRHITDQQGGAVASAANNNNISGVWRSLTNAPQNHAALVLEMGFGRPLDGIARSAIVAKPHVAVLTTMDVAHFDMFTPKMLAQKTGLQWLCDLKSTVFSGLEPGGAAILGREMAEYGRAKVLALAQTARVYSYGLTSDCDARLEAIELDPTGSVVQATVAGRPLRFRLNVLGRHMAVNALGALLATWAGGFDLAAAVGAIEGFAPVKGRARVDQIPLAAGGTAVLIDDSFNATLASMRSTLALLADAKPQGLGRRIAVLGEIGHIGADEIDQHRNLVHAVKNAGVDRVFAWGPLMRGMFEALDPHQQGDWQEASVESLYQSVIADLRHGDVITIKSGRGQGGLGDFRFRKFAEHLRAAAPALVL
ncbi:MAG: Mur ligase family protein [Paracoccaceae bacterium]